MNNTLYERTANEPIVRPLISKSFIFVPTAGMRLAPEVLVLELFREAFFKSHYGSTKTKELNPDEVTENGSFAYSINERAVLHSLLGRRKKTKGSKVQQFFAPAYPSLARKSWLGKNRERVIKNFLLGGPIHQYLWHSGPDVQNKKQEQERLIELLYDALIGHKSCFGNDFYDKDILSVALRNIDFKINKEDVKNILEEKTAYSDESIIRIDQDELATRIFKDVEYICELERSLPRMQWIQVLMTFLRFALPIWLLSQMRITSLLHEWLLQAVDEGKIVDSQNISKQISSRNRSLLYPTLTPNRAVFEHIERYMKHRVELNILLRWLEDIRPNEIKGKKLDVAGGSAGTLSIERLVLIARDAKDDLRSLGRFKEVADELDIRHFLIREGELFSAWRNPFLGGQGKNIDEFLRVMYRDDQGDEAGGYLLIPEGRGPGRGFRVFPGQLLLKTVTYLAAKDKRACDQHAGGGKLVLEDVENHFQQYGIDFYRAAEARPLLVNQLQIMGLLTGSPDAGSSVAVSCPY